MIRGLYETVHQQTPYRVSTGTVLLSSEESACFMACLSTRRFLFRRHIDQGCRVHGSLVSSGRALCETIAGCPVFSLPREPYLALRESTTSGCVMHSGA